MIPDRENVGSVFLPPLTFMKALPPLIYHCLPMIPPYSFQPNTRSMVSHLDPSWGLEDLLGPHMMPPSSLLRVCNQTNIINSTFQYTVALNGT